MPDTHTAKKPDEATSEEMAKVNSWFESIFPNPELRRANISILKSGFSGKRIEYFFVATGDGCAGMGGLNEMLAERDGGVG